MEGMVGPSGRVPCGCAPSSWSEVGWGEESEESLDAGVVGVEEVVTGRQDGHAHCVHGIDVGAIVQKDVYDIRMTVDLEGRRDEVSHGLHCQCWAHGSSK